MYQNVTLAIMGVLRRLYGGSPRVRVVEAILELSPLESFSAPSVAAEANVNRARAKQILKDLERLGFVIQGTEGWGEKYSANKRSPWFKIASHSDFALSAVEEMGSETSAASDAAEEFRIRTAEVADDGFGWAAEASKVEILTDSMDTASSQGVAATGGPS